MRPYKKLWSKIKKQIKAINSGKSSKYESGFMKIEVDSNDKLSLKKVLYTPVLDIIVESVFQVNDGYYPQIYGDECKYKCEFECV